MQIPQIPWQYDESRIVYTSAYEATQAWLSEALTAPGIYTLLGEPGVGKTFGAIKYALENRIPIITPPADQKETSGRRWLRYLCAHLTPNYDPRADDPYMKLCEWAEAQPLPRLIIDEAVRLNRLNLDILRDIADRYPASILLIGTKELERKLAYYDTIVHRVCGVWRIPPLNMHDIETLYEVPRNVAEELYRITKGNMRHLRLIANRIENTHTSALTPAYIRSITSTTILNKEAQP